MLIMFKFRSYKHNTDFEGIRRFLITNNDSSYPLIWTFERWNYAYYFVRHMFGFTEDEWAKRIGIWENKEGEIAAIANFEGIGRGEAFFQINKLYLNELPLEEMFEFAEKYLFLEDKNTSVVKIRILEGLEIVEEMARKRNYSKVPKAYETTTFFSLEQEIVKPKISSEFKIRSMDDDNNIVKRARVFAKAFGNFGTEDEVKSHLYEELQKSPDYRKDLDVYLINSEGEYVSFCLIWYDEKNKLGILEPVGTDPDYRKQGLGKAAVFEAIRRVKEIGAEKILVGDGQQFYRSIGFSESHKNAVWKKEISIER